MVPDPGHLRRNSPRKFLLKGDVPLLDAGIVEVQGKALNGHRVEIRKVQVLAVRDGERRTQLRERIDEAWRLRYVEIHEEGRILRGRCNVAAVGRAVEQPVAAPQ